MPLTPRERVLTAIHHEEPDRVPIIIGTSNTTTLKLRPYQRLKARLGIQAQDQYLYDWPELGSARLDEETLQRLGSDARGVWDRFPEEIYRKNAVRLPGSPFFDDWGVGAIEIEPGVWFPGIHPLAEAQTLEEIERYPWPDPEDPSRMVYAGAEARRLQQENCYAVVGAPWLLFPLERAFAMQGMDRFLISLALDPDFAQALLEKIYGVCKHIMKEFLRETGDFLDIIKIGDDLGTQNSLIISPKMYRRFLKPIHADFINFIKQRTKAKVFFHSDGDIYPLLDDLVEIGVDILNPIQTAAGMMANLNELKQRYGTELVLCGGIDTQRILPYGSPDEVRAEVRRVIQALGPGGGYLLSSVHTIMNEVPPENILAMVDAAVEFGSYPMSSGKG